MNNKSIFITATGTDIGKTYISALLVKKLRECNINCGYYKPVLSGAEKKENEALYLGDAEYVIKTAGMDCEADCCVSYAFEEAVSPHLASKRVGKNICLNKIFEDYNFLSQKYDFVVVEGAGGITCPFSVESGLLLPDVIKALKSSIIIVADAGLGTINSTILTVEYAKSKNINIFGIILNNYDESNFMHIDNKDQIEKMTGINVIATVANGDVDLRMDKQIIENMVKVGL